MFLSRKIHRSVKIFFMLDTVGVKLYKDTMNKQERFRKLIKRNRKKLLENGFNPSTISMYISGKRIPQLDKAANIATILDIKMDKIPSRKWTIK